MKVESETRIRPKIFVEDTITGTQVEHERYAPYSSKHTEFSIYFVKDPHLYFCMKDMETTCQVSQRHSA
jgi:hypothetical protein